MEQLTDEQLNERIVELRRMNPFRFTVEQAEEYTALLDEYERRAKCKSAD